jgi:glucose-fructose oxidoreductase
MIAYRLHFEKGNLEAIQLATSGKLGEVRAFTSEFGQQVVEDNIRLTEPIEKGGGPIYDMGVYCINAARYLFREEPIEILASSASSDDPKFRKAGEMVSVIMRFPNERLATFTCSFGSADVSRYTLLGTKGMLTADPAYDYSMAIKHRITIDEQTTTRTFPKRDQFAAELTYFSDCIRKNKDPEPSGIEGLADIRIVRAIYESAQAGKKVELPPLTKKQRPTLQQEIHHPAHGKPETVDTESPSGEAA